MSVKSMKEMLTYQESVRFLEDEVLKMLNSGRPGTVSLKIEVNNGGISSASLEWQGKKKLL